MFFLYNSEVSFVEGGGICKILAINKSHTLQPWPLQFLMKTCRCVRCKLFVASEQGWLEVPPVPTSFRSFSLVFAHKPGKLETFLPLFFLSEYVFMLTGQNESFPSYFVIVSLGNHFLRAISRQHALSPGIILPISAFCHCQLDFRLILSSCLPCGVLDAWHIKAN